MNRAAVILIVAVGTVRITLGQGQFIEDLGPLIKAGASSWVVSQLLERAVEIAFPKSSADDDYNQGLEYQNGWNGKSKDPLKAMTFFRSAAAKGSSDAQCILGDYYRDHGDGKNALKWYKMAADHNHSHALYELAAIYSEGKWVQANPSTAFYFVKRAAEQGGSQAQYMTGSLLWLGFGVTRDVGAAANYFELAAKQGHAGAEQAIGLCYATGEGRPPSFSKAKEYFEQAARQGEVMAEYNLGVMYENGDGVIADACQATHWYRVAANSGNEGARQRLQGLVVNRPCGE